MTSDTFEEAVSGLRERSIRECGVHPVDVEDALILYSVTYLTSLRVRCPKVVEVGTGCGYSTAWLAKALKDSGRGCGKVVTIERRAERAEVASENLRGLGLSHLVDFRVGDALKILREVEGEINVLFLDGAWEEEEKYLRIAAGKLVEDAVIMMHNAYVVPRAYPGVLNALREQGFSYSVVPTPQGLLLASRRKR